MKSTCATSSLCSGLVGNISAFSHPSAYHHSWNQRPMHNFRGKNYLATELKVSRIIQELPRQHSDKESACQCWRHRRCKFDPWVGKISWRRAWQPTPVFLPGESHGQRSLVGYSAWGQSMGYSPWGQTQLSNWAHTQSYMEEVGRGGSQNDSSWSSKTIEAPLYNSLIP